jgi:citrate/tricarballylate utilization protein
MPSPDLAMGSRELPMLPPDLLTEARRQIDICNACRYCEGVCGVFPALERRTTFEEGDVFFLANLCHDCRACLYVCPFAPPHEFGVNFPKLMADVRVHTHEQFSWPSRLQRVLSRSRPAIVALLLALVAIVFGASLLGVGAGELLIARTGPGAFYEVIPWFWMFAPATLLTILGFIVVGIGFVRFWRTMGRSSPVTAGLRDVGDAMWDAATLRYLDGGGPGCDYPDEAPSRSRAWWHHLVAYGFVSAFISTSIAFVYQEIFGWLPPYPILSLPVIFGSVGGVAMIIGGIGLIALKRRSDKGPASASMLAMDYTFLAMLLIVNVTGMLLLAMRSTVLMPILLDIHLATVFGFFITAPYGKFTHAVYRYAALARNRLEERSEAAAAAHG